MSRHVAAVSLVMLWVLVPADRALAQVKDLLRGALEGAVTSAIQNEVKKPQVTTSANTATSTREENRQIQMALNHFGYPAGTADGILGRRSSAAIAKFQASNGHSATGTLTNPQKSALLSSWRRSASGTPVNGVDLLGVFGAGQLILDDGSVSPGRRRQRTTTTTATAGVGDTVLQDSDQALERKRRRTVIDPIAGDQTGSTTIASPGVATEPSLRSATRGEQTGESTAVTTTRRTSTTSNTATTERRQTATSNTTTTTVQPAETRIVPTGSSGGTSASSAARLRCQLRGSDPSACIAGN